MNRNQLVIWRARAYQGSVLGPGSPAPEVSEVLGTAALGPDLSTGDSFNERIVWHVHRVIAVQIESSPMSDLNPVTALRPFMTIAIETRNETDCERGDSWSQVARLDLICDGRAAHAGIWVEGAAQRLLPTISVLDGDTAWSVFVCLLALPRSPACARNSGR